MKVLSLAVAAAFVLSLASAGQDSKISKSTEIVRAGTGSIKGTVTLSGKAPRRKKIPVGSDPVCADLHPADNPLYTEELVVKEVDGKSRLQWAAVFITSNVEGKLKTEPQLLDQKGCHYEPHILVLTVKQPIRIRSSDDTMHNIHALPIDNNEFNFSQRKVGEEAIKTFDKVEWPIKIKCDVHSWMGAWAIVLPHPYATVTKEDGTYEIKDVPSGKHKLTFWHEKFGKQQEVDVTVEDGKPATADLEFKGE